MSLISKSLIWGGALAWGVLAFNAPQFTSPNSKPVAFRASASGYSIDPATADVSIPKNREMIRHEPLSGTALRDLALGVAGGDLREARAGLEIAEQVTRRDQWTQLFLIESNAQLDRTRAVLQRYDNLLTVNGELAPTLLQKLSGGLASPEIRQELRRYAQRPWMLNLVQTAAANSADPLAAYNLAKDFDLLSPALPDETVRGLLRGLLVNRHAGEAAAAADRVAGADLRNWRGFWFTGVTTHPRLNPLTWDIAGSADLMTSIDSQGRLNVIEVTGKPATVASRYMALTAGSYVLTLPVTSNDSGGADLHWEVSCPGSSAPVVVAEDFVDKVITARLRLGLDCNQQLIRLMYRPDDHQGSRQFLLGPLTIAYVKGQ